MFLRRRRSKMVHILSCYNFKHNLYILKKIAHFRYHPWSFLNSPGWVQIKCELRILSQFAFNLNPDWELPVKKETQSQPLKDGVRDMLVKHHLFSWDL